MLHVNLYSDVFASVLHRVWVRVVSNIDALLKPETKQLQLPVTPRQASILKGSLEVVPFPSLTHMLCFADLDFIRCSMQTFTSYA